MASEDARAKPVARETNRVEPEPRDDVRVASSAVRCPFCHDGVAPEVDDWVACQRCLARHHAGCWTEARACATCGHETSISGADRSGAGQGLLFAASVIVILFAFAAFVIVALKAW